MSTTTNLAARLAEKVGSQPVAAAPGELMGYAVDGLAPGVVVRPASVEETVEVVRFALSEKLAVLPHGSRSKCDMGMAPSRYDVGLEMVGLSKIAHYDAGDLTLSVDAGMPLRELEVFLRRHGQFLPLAVPCFESTTAGGAVASGIDSALRLQYGTARDFLIGAEFVDGKGQLCKSGGRVVKNVTGYDLHKMLIGSLGTLGVITRLNFRTYPLPAASGGHLATFADGMDALAYRESLQKAGVTLTNVEVLSPEAGTMIRAILRRSHGKALAELEEGMWCVYCAYEGTEAVVRRISSDLEGNARSTRGRHSAILGAESDELLGGMLRESFEWLRWAATATVVFRVALPDVPPEAIAELARATGTAEVRSALLIRAAGVIYFTLFSDNEADLLAPVQRIGGMVASLARSRGGSATLLHAPLAAKLKAAEQMAERLNLALQQRVKQAFDPSGLFVPGRVVGGI